jgi:hypothetical protein
MTPEQPLPPTTTAQQDITTAGQRRVNLIWEFTQAIIAILIVAANIFVWTSSAIKGSGQTAPAGLNDSLFVVITFYYTRTNHTRIGGVGEKSGTRG